MKEQLHGSPKESFSKKAAWLVLRKVPVFSVSVLTLAGCSGGVGEKNDIQELKNNESSGYALPFPEGETWFLTNGPHADGYSNGIKYGIDIAPPELGRLNGNCPTDGSRLSIDNRVVTASASGEVIVVGKDNNRNDPHHSEIRIKNKNGLTQTYIHLDNTKIKVGDKVNQGYPLGNPSCEFPPGGGNSGPHVHVGLMRDGQAIPIDGIVVGGWTIHNGVDGKDGTMTKPGEQTRTANTGRYADPNGTIRNDLPNNSSKAVVAEPKDPIRPISATITSKGVLGATAIPTQTKETSTQIQKEQPKSIEQQAQEIVLRTWLNLWNSEQESHRVPVNFVNIEITNTNVEDIINKKGVLTNSLNAKWIGGHKVFHPWEDKEGGSKYVGEAQIDKIKINTSGNVPTSDADKANGLQWTGRVSIAYIIRYHGYDYRLKDWSLSSDAMEKWLHSEEANAFPNFSPWKEESVGARLMLKNGKWEINQLYLPNSEMGSSTLSGLKLPSEVLTYGGQTLGHCSYEEGSPCRIIEVDPQK